MRRRRPATLPSVLLAAALVGACAWAACVLLIRLAAAAADGLTP